METPQGQIRLVDAIECSCRAEPNGNTHSKNAANSFYSFKFNALNEFSGGGTVASVAKSLHLAPQKKGFEDQSLARPLLQAPVAKSFRCSAFSTDAGRFQNCGAVGRSRLASEGAPKDSARLRGLFAGKPAPTGNRLP
ncbi:hypothetical protein J4P02_14565 [Pseudomonas sp. NFXW11]|uniref:hypothetical protein n=1 Tax=Pseudomonas sp. NFXW11 TaxID=2819531 RepID=UPI003CEF3F2B